MRPIFVNDLGKLNPSGEIPGDGRKVKALGWSVIRHDLCPALSLSGTVRVTAVVDVIRELNICPDDWAVIPIKANRFSLTKNLP